MKAPHGTILAEVERIKAVLKAYGFKPLIVESGPDVVVETYEGVIPNFLSLREDYRTAGMRVVRPVLMAIHDYSQIYDIDPTPVAKIVSRQPLILRADPAETIRPGKIPLAEDEEYILDRCSVGGYFAAYEGVRLLPLQQRKNVLSQRLRFSRESWCAVLLDPETTDAYYWDFILDGVLLQLVGRGFWGYVVMLCPSLNPWDTARGWQKEVVSVGVERFICIEHEGIEPGN